MQKLQVPVRKTSSSGCANPLVPHVKLETTKEPAHFDFSVPFAASRTRQNSTTPEMSTSPALPVPLRLDSVSDQSKNSESPAGETEPKVTARPLPVIPRILNSRPGLAPVPLPRIPGPPSDGQYPPLQTWEDICNEMRSICQAFRIPC